jgi:hypothetical protein
MSRLDNRRHPCLTCHLPECDDTSSKCPLRQALYEYQKYLRKKLTVPDDVRERYSLAYREIHYWRRREEQKMRAEAASHA